MKKSTWVIIGVLGALGITTGVAIAKKHGRHGGMGMGYLIKMADTNKDGAVSAEEFNAMLKTGFDKSDANSDGEVTKGELVDGIGKMAEGKHHFSRHSGRMADYMFRRFDINQDGKVTREEFENRANKMYALADWNDDGKVEMAELRRTRMSMEGGHHGRRHGGGNGGDHGKHGGKHHDGHDMKDEKGGMQRMEGEKLGVDEPEMEEGGENQAN